MKQNTNGTGFLKVTGILMIIFGSIMLVITLLGISALVYLDSQLMGIMSLETLYVAAVLSLIGAVVQFVAGIVGVKNCRNPQKAGLCLGFGIATAVISTAGALLAPLAGSEINFVSIIFGLVLPILFILGAIKNKA